MIQKRINFIPTLGDYVTLQGKEEWGLGQVQSVINERVTVNFSEAGKQTINITSATLVAAEIDNDVH